jgi:hypothetical protein
MNQVEMQTVMPASFVGTSSCVPHQEHVGGTQMTLLPPATHVICSIVGWPVTHGWTQARFRLRHGFGTSFTKGIAYLKLSMILLQVAFAFVRLREETTRAQCSENHAEHSTYRNRSCFRVDVSTEDRQPNRFHGITDSVRGPSPPRLLARSTIARANWRAYQLSMRRLTKSGQAEFTPSGGEDGGKEEEG